ncbi:extracellular calcium-sensing receptor [Sinocyclocheilus rhinocerous]|uniref:extracellular calcium-sensing receptor n=1 Tax=Sinocyclocheilus rhinocerous TaxID=307959 RepID=UPI0007BA8A69|nr:PREDICTED: extracellular calcium-sensing receptor-like [Sinocyclocheilus rhinocerous]
MGSSNIVLVFSLLFMHAGSTCQLRGKFEMPNIFKAGEIMIGGIFPIFNKQENVIASFERKMRMINCTGFDLRAFRWTQVMMFAIDEINQDEGLLPNISLGYKIMDSCASPTNVLRAAFTLVSEQREEESTTQCHLPLTALVAESGSSQSLAVAGTLGPFRVPMVSYFSTCACLSDRRKYPSFFRTLPSDYYQAKALASLVKRYGWTWVGAVQSDNDYGKNGISAFSKEVEKMGVCIAFVGTILRTYPQSKIIEVVELIKQSTVKVILAFVPEGDLYPLMRETVKQNITGIQWIASEAWVTAARPSTPEMFKSFGGTVGFVVRKMAMPKLGTYLKNISPYFPLQSTFVSDFWETMVGCKPCLNCEPLPFANVTLNSQMCTGEEKLNYTDKFFDVTQVRVTYNVYQAVYAIAHAIHKLLFCQRDKNNVLRQCLNVSQITPKLVSDHLQRVNFVDEYGENVFFDENGDPPASYEVINWQLRGGEVQHVIVGYFSTSTDGTYKLTVKEDKIHWNTGNLIPKAVCSDTCPNGTRKAQIKGRPVCCFDCIPCADGSISNTTGAADCILCPEEYWSNERRDKCVMKMTEFLSYTETMGIILTALSLFGASLSVATMIIFMRFRETPIVKANNSELSSLLLVSLFFCFLCPLTFIGEPTVWSCMLRHTAFGVTFALCISCVLGKTIVVVTAFRATLPGNKLAGKFGSVQQRVIVFSCTAIQIVICVLWLIISPPFPDKALKYNNKKIILECNTGSDVAFYAVLGYIGILSAICLILAFLARKLPDNFNEAKFISFSMLIFCAVWATFIPAYISSPGKYTVAVEIFAILSSAFGLLLCIFVPKCYIILIKPERNTKKHLMGKFQKTSL